MAKYRNKTKLGSGGFAEVWEVSREGDGKRFARKKLIDQSDEAVKRFQREVRILSKLDHPRIIKVVGVKLKTPPYWYVMPLYKYSLYDELPNIIDNSNRISSIYSAVLEGMEYAHKQGVIHRDLKPENILFNNDSDLVISDFGLGRALDATTARKTKTGQMLGTFFCMAPEQFRDPKSVDARADIFSLGRLLYELYGGELSSTQDLSNIPAGIAMIIDRCTKSDPGERFQSVTDLLDSFRSICDETTFKTAKDELEVMVGKLVAGASLSKEGLKELNDLICKVEPDEDRIHEICIKLPDDVFTELHEKHPLTARKIVNIFTKNVTSQGWPFEYTDRIGDACERLFLATDDPSIRAKLLAALLEVGVGHNRWHVMGIFRKLISDEITEADALTVETEFEGLEYYLRQIADELNLAKLPRRLRRFIEKIIEA